MDSNSQLTFLPASLDEAKIQSLPASAYYIADFISKDEEQTLLSKIASAPKPRWKHLSHRRLQTWPSDLTKNTLLEESLPKWLVEPVITRLLKLQCSASPGGGHVFSGSPHGVPNHVLVNEYLPNQGIMAHKDGAAYHPVVCTVSLGASLCLDIYGTKSDGTRATEPSWKILQEPRSLLITTDELYTEYLHGIAEVDADVNLSATTVANWNLLRSPETIIEGRNEREVRISLTYRDVIKVSKLGGRMFGKR